jgi:hypothetical protein
LARASFTAPSIVATSSAATSASIAQRPSKLISKARTVQSGMLASRPAAKPAPPVAARPPPPPPSTLLATAPRPALYAPKISRPLAGKH